jgi:hypothetical protein
MYVRICKEPCAFIRNFNGLHRTLITFAIFLIFNLIFSKPIVRRRTFVYVVRFLNSVRSNPEIVLKLSKFTHPNFVNTILSLMSGYKEPFPNSEELLRSAFALSDPTPALLQLIKAYPTADAVRDLLIFYIDAVEANPSRAYALASVLVALRDSPDAPVILSDSSDAPFIQDSSTLAEAFDNELDDLHARGSVFDKDNKTFGPTNTYLINSLLSGLSFKYNLTLSPTQYSYIEDGLHVDDNSSICQLLLIGACIQLLTNGSRIVPTGKPFIRSANEVLIKLRFQQSAGRITDLNALKLLDVCQLLIRYKLELIVFFNSLPSRTPKADSRKKMTSIMSGSCSFLRWSQTNKLPGSCAPTLY